MSAAWEDRRVFTHDGSIYFTDSIEELLTIDEID